jgi:hypothetical protein
LWRCSERLDPSDQDEAGFAVGSSAVARWPRSDPMTGCICGYAFAKISDALCPPKPIELESAVVMLLARAVLGT